MEDEFEQLYHCILNKDVHSYEKELYTCMVVYPDETCDILEPFLQFFQKTKVHQWWEMIKYQHVKEHRMTSGQRKERRLMIRHVYRLAKFNVKVMRVLDLVLQHVRMKDM
jgi:hypothetical protein